MRFRVVSFVHLLFITLSIAGTARANTPLVSSTFDSGTDGWLNVTLPYPSAVPPTITFSFTPQATSGRLTMSDPDGTSPSGDAQYWCAPAKFLGNQSGAGVLGCELSNVGSGNGPFAQEDVVLVGGGLTLSYSFGSLPPQVATPVPFTLDLYGGGAHLGGLSAPLATSTQVSTVLASLTALYIRAEYQLGPDTQAFDNVTLFTPNVGVEDGDAAPTLALARPIPNPSTGTMRVAFTLATTDAVDLGVFDVHGRRIATLAHGTLPAGQHAATWNGADANGRLAGAGLYWLELAQGGMRATRRVVRVK